MTVVQWMLSVILTLLITLLFERIYPPKRLLLIYETYSPEDFISKISGIEKTSIILKNA